MKRPFEYPIFFFEQFNVTYLQVLILLIYYLRMYRLNSTKRITFYRPRILDIKKIYNFISILSMVFLRVLLNLS